MNVKHINIVHYHELVSAKIKKYLPDKITTLCDRYSWERRKIITFDGVLGLMWPIFWS